MQKISLIPTILLIAVWIDFVFLSFVIKQEHYTYLNLLPLALGVFLLFDFDWFERAKKYQGYMIFLCTLFIRYAIAPTVLYLADFKVSMDRLYLVYLSQMLYFYRYMNCLPYLLYYRYTQKENIL